MQLKRTVSKWGEELRWRLDRVVSRGVVAIVTSVAVLLIALTFLGAGLRQTVRSEDVDASFWSSFSRLIDLSSIQQDRGWGGRLVSLGFLFVGIVFSSLWIALVVTALQNSIDRVRNGRTKLHQTPDLLILGWSDQLFTLVREFAHGSTEHRVVAILSSHPRAWMDEMITRECGGLEARLSVHCRSADRTDPRDLDLVLIEGIRRIVIFGEPDDRDDSEVVKSIFAVLTASTNVADRSIIAEVCAAEVSSSLNEVFGSRVTTVNSNEILSLVLAQAVRQQGMGQLLDQLTSYRGGEFYEQEVPAEFVGRTFGELCWRCDNACPIGVSRDGIVRVLPPLSFPLAPRDLVLTVQRRHEPMTWTSVGTEFPAELKTCQPLEPVWLDQRIAIVGWNVIVARAVEHVRGFLGSGSVLTVIVDRASMSEAEAASLESCESVDERIWTDTPHQRLKMLAEQLVQPFDAVAIVPYRDEFTPSQSDAHTLVSLAAVRGALPADGCRVVTEIRETRSAGLTALVRPDDLLLSDAVTASLVAQMIDRPWLDAVLADLLDYHGAALFIVPGASFGQQTDVTFLEIRRESLQRGELAIGIRSGVEIVLNPQSTTPVDLKTLTGVVTVGAGVGWGADMTKMRIVDLTA